MTTVDLEMYEELRRTSNENAVLVNVLEQQISSMLQDLRHARSQLEHVYAHHRRDPDRIEKANRHSQLWWWREGLATIDALIGQGYADAIIDDVQKELDETLPPGRQQG